MVRMTTEKSSFLNALSAVSAAVAHKSTIPILENVLFSKQGDQVQLVAYDLEMQVTAEVPGLQCEDDFAVTVNARNFQQVFDAAPADTVRMNLDGNQIKLVSGSIRAQLNTLPADGFPRFARDRDAHRLSLPQEAFKRALFRVHHAMAANDPARYFLNGALLEVQESALRLVATDSYRLSFHETALAAAHPAQRVILPRKTVLQLLRLLDDSDDPIDLEIGLRAIAFRFGTLSVLSKMIDGQFPDYQRVLPAGYPHSVDLERKPLLEAVRRAAILATDLGAIHLHITDNRLCISGKNKNQEEAIDELTIPMQMEEFDINLNFHYLQDALAALDTDTITLAFGRNDQPLLLSPPGSTTFRYVIMPMRV